MNRVIPKMKTESGKISYAFQGGKLYNRPKTPKKTDYYQTDYYRNLKKNIYSCFLNLIIINTIII